MKFNNQNLQGKSFRGQHLAGASFRKADLRGADFSYCDLKSADFTNADCSGAKFDGASFGPSKKKIIELQFTNFLLSSFSYFTLIYMMLSINPPYDDVKETASKFVAIQMICAVIILAITGFTRRSLMNLFLLTSLLFSIFYICVVQILSYDHWFESVGVVIFYLSYLILSTVMFTTLVISGTLAKFGSILGFFAGSAFWIISTFRLYKERIDYIKDYSFDVFVQNLTVTDYTHVMAILGLFFFQNYVGWRVRKFDHRFGNIGARIMKMRDSTSYYFQGANLSDASFSNTYLAGVGFIGANLSRVNWSGAKGLEAIVHSDPVLWYSDVANLLSSRCGKDITLCRADLHETDLRGVDLRGANLKEANLAGAVLRDADLTGACIESWNIDSKTDLKGVKCSYIFLQEKQDEFGQRKRRPADPERNFELGEFGVLYTEAIRQMDVLLKNRLPLGAIGEVVGNLAGRHPGVGLTKLEPRGENIIISFAVPMGTDEAAVDRSLLALWEAKVRLLEQHNRDLKDIAMARTSAMQLIGGKMEYKNFHGTVTISNSTVHSLLGDVINNAQTLSRAGAESTALAEAIKSLALAIEGSKELTEPQRLEASQKLATIAEAAKAPTDSDWKTAATTALHRITELFSKASELTNLVVILGKAWDAVSKSVGA